MTDSEITKFAQDLQKTASWAILSRMLARAGLSIAKFFRGARAAKPIVSGAPALAKNIGTAYKTEAGNTLFSRTMSHIKDFASKNYSAPIVKKIEGDVSKLPTHRPWLGTTRAPTGIVTRSNPGLSTSKWNIINPKRILAEGAHNIAEFRDMGAGNWLKKHMGEAKFYTKKLKVDGVDTELQFRGSHLGNIGRTAVTGPGILGADLVMSDPNQPFVKRLGGATGSGALWGLNPRLGMAKATAEMAMPLFKRKKQIIQ